VSLDDTSQEDMFSEKAKRDSFNLEKEDRLVRKIANGAR